MKTILPRNPSRHALLARLGFPKGKMPADFTFDGYLPLEDRLGKSYGIFHVIVTETKPSNRTRTRWNLALGKEETKPVKSSSHRIFAKFGSRLIPVGRLAQAILPEGEVPFGC